jgi:hypothetical protein
LFFMDPLHPLHLFAVSILTSFNEFSTRTRIRIVAETLNFTAQPLYLSILPVFVGCTVFCVLWKFFCCRATEVLASRTITIREVDDLMMKHACGCDCEEVTSISNVAVAPSPELSFEPSKHPQLLLDSCVSVSQFFCVFVWRLDKMNALKKRLCN